MRYVDNNEGCKRGLHEWTVCHVLEEHGAFRATRIICRNCNIDSEAKPKIAGSDTKDGGGTIAASN